jgi:hypothetical protein
VATGGYDKQSASVDEKHAEGVAATYRRQSQQLPGPAARAW